MEILYQIEDARKEFVDKIGKILPCGYRRYDVNVWLFEEEKNGTIVENTEWEKHSSTDINWSQSKENNGKTYVYTEEA